MSGVKPIACFDDCLYYLSENADQEIKPFITDENLKGAYKYKATYRVDSDEAQELLRQPIKKFIDGIRRFEVS